MDLKKLFVRHGEKIGLAAAILIFFVVVVKTNIMPPEDLDIKAARDQADEIERRLTSDKPPQLPLFDYTAKNASQWNSVAQAKPGNTWAIYRPTVYKADVKLAEKVAEKYLHAPKLLEPKLALGKVTLNWENDKRTTASVAGYKVFRKGPQGDWKSLTDAAISGTSFIDDKVEPKRKYQYKVSAETKDAVVKDKVKESEAVEAATLGVIQVIFRGGTLQMAQILVRKLDTGQENMFLVKPGDMIGGIVIVDTKRTKVDYSTGYKLNDIKKEKRKYVRKEIEKVWAPDGTYTPKEVEKEQFITEMKIYFTDDEGKDGEMWVEVEAKKEPVKKDPDKPDSEKKEPEKKEPEKKGPDIK